MENCLYLRFLDEIASTFVRRYTRLSVIRCVSFMIATLHHHIAYILYFYTKKIQWVFFFSAVNVFGIISVIILTEYICTHVFNLSKYYLPESVYYWGENTQLRFWNYEVWNVIVRHGNHKPYTVLLHLAVCIYIHNFKRFHSGVVKILAIF